MKFSLVLKLTLLLLLIISCYYFSGKPLGKWLYYDKPLKRADLILVEGWLNEQDILFADNKFQQGNYKFIITSGVRNSGYFMAGSNGDIIFHIPESIVNEKYNKLTVNAYGSQVNEITAKMEVFVNNISLGNCYTKTTPQSYPFSFSTVDNNACIKIRFLNDTVKGNNDRNLFISGITVNSKFYSVNDTSVIYRIRSSRDSSVHYMGLTKAIQAKEILKHLGVPTSKIIAISTLKSSLSRTYSTAKETMFKIDSIFPDQRISFNIVTGVLHSRRTYYAYKKNIKEGDSVGVIVAPPVEPLVWSDRKRNLKELTGIIYNLLHF